MIVGIVSGYFNPLHQGHIEYINAAKLQCEWLIAIINNDCQVKLKGSKPFMDHHHREFIIRNLKSVDSTYIALDNDKTVTETIRWMRELHENDEILFFNSGDRVPVANSESKERLVCKELKIKYVAIPLPKRYSSSTLLASV